MVYVAYGFHYYLTWLIGVGLYLLYQGCFRRSVSVVTIYASLGEEALCHSLNEVLSLSL